MQVKYIDLKQMPYRQAWDYQESLLNHIIEQKLSPERLAESGQLNTDNFLLFVEHPHVFTLGKSGSEKNLLADYIQLQAKDAEFVHTNRGGDITYHGPGQIVGYPILNLDYFAKGVRDYIDKREESIILTLKVYGIIGYRIDGATGVWLKTTEARNARKICAIGVRVSRGVTMHGFALNVNSDLSYFLMINPCGFTDKEVTSMEKELGIKLNLEEVKGILRTKIAEVFGMQLFED
jgi:lipoyl(octanoyl) transferase